MQNRDVRYIIAKGKSQAFRKYQTKFLKTVYSTNVYIFITYIYWNNAEIDQKETKKLAVTG